MKSIILVIATLTLAGCGAISSGLKTETETMRANKAGDKQEIGMFAIQANARVIIANVNEGRFCAEPPPETQTTESTSFRLMLEAALDSEEDTAKIEAFRAFSQGLRQLYKRSHTNQLYRDSSYYLCQAYLNGALTDKNIKLFLNMLVSETETQEQKSISAQAKKLIDQIDAQTTDIKGAYLSAQLLLSQWAFASLKNEVTAFYNAEAKVNEGKAVAYAEGLSQMSANIKAIEASLEQVGSTANSTLEKAGENSDKLDSLTEEVGKLPKESGNGG